MAVVDKWYSNAILNLLKAGANIDTATIKCMLTTSSYTPNQNSHDYRDDITNEVSATGYTSGGAEITNAALSIASNVITLDGDDMTWSITGTLVARYAVIYVSIGTSATDILIGYVDFGADVTAIDGAFKITWNASGILKATVSTS